MIEAEPKLGHRAVDSGAKIFSKVRAKIWIEQATYHWVKMDAQGLWRRFRLASDCSACGSRRDASL